MTLIFVLIPFAVAVLLVFVIKIILLTNKGTAPIAVPSGNICTNAAIAPEIFQKVIKINSNHNTPFMSNVPSTCLEYLCDQEMDEDCKNENTIIKNLEGKL